MNIKYFITPQCSVCHALEAKAKALAEKYNILFETINIEQNPELKGKFLLFSAPSLIIFNEDKEIKRFVRNFGLLEVENFIKRFI